MIMIKERIEDEWEKWWELEQEWIQAQACYGNSYGIAKNAFIGGFFAERKKKEERRIV